MISDEEDINDRLDLIKGDPGPPEHEHPYDSVGGAAHGGLLAAVPPPDPRPKHLRRCQ